MAFHAAMKPLVGQVLSVTGAVAPEALGKVLMHEHLHSDLYDKATDSLIWEEKPITPERRQYLLDNAVPLLRESREKYGLNAYCDVTMPPWRAWPDIYPEVSQASGVNIVLATGFYREIETGTYFVSTPDRAIWPYVRESSVEELTEMCVREITEGIHGTDVRAGCIKLGSSQAPLTPTETKAFRAGARAQLATGVMITTHCTQLGADTSQLTILDTEGVDLRRVVIGHTGWHLSDKSYRRAIINWMKRGANFMPTNLDVRKPEHWTLLIEAIHEVFDAGLGGHLVLGMDHGYCSERGIFEPMDFMPPHPWTYMFTDVLPVFRSLGLTAEEERVIMEENPQRLLPVQAT